MLYIPVKINDQGFYAFNRLYTVSNPVYKETCVVYLTLTLLDWLKVK